MKNIRLLIEYDGSRYHGWQRQAGKPSIQGEIESVLARVTGQRTVLYGSSRTDSGVHAVGQVANFYSTYPMDPEKWTRVLNFYLPIDIRIQSSKEAPPEFHSQKKVKSKAYSYRVLNRRVQSAIDRQVYFMPRPLDWSKIRLAMHAFLGEHDFRAFQGAKSQVRTTRRRIYRFDLFEEAPGLFHFEIEGSGFLKQMVRAVIGTLIQVGEGKIADDAIPGIIESRDRRRAGRTAPPEGLCLVAVHYVGEESSDNGRSIFTGLVRSHRSRAPSSALLGPRKKNHSIPTSQEILRD